MTSVLWWAGPPFRLRPSQMAGGHGPDLRRHDRHPEAPRGAGLVERLPDETDGRASLAGLTAAGRELAEATMGSLVDYDDLVTDLPTSRRQDVAAALRTMIDLLEADLGLADSSFDAG